MPTTGVNRLQVSVIIEGQVQGSAGAILPVYHKYSYNMTDGSGANQAGNVYRVLGGTVAAGTPVSVDMAGWTDFQGNTVSAPVNVKFYVIAVTAVSAAGTTLDVTAGAANHLITMFPDASKGLRLQEEGVFVAGSPEKGYAITAGTGDLILLTATGGTVTYDMIAIVGE